MSKETWYSVKRDLVQCHMNIAYRSVSDMHIEDIGINPQIGNYYLQRRLLFTYRRQRHQFSKEYTVFSQCKCTLGPIKTPCTRKKLYKSLQKKKL